MSFGGFKTPDIRVVLLLFVCSHVKAGTGGNVSGTVTDPHNLPVYAARITAVNTSTQRRYSVLTNSIGVYSLQDLAVGTYDVEVEANGFRVFRSTQMTVDVARILHDPGNKSIHLPKIAFHAFTFGVDLRNQ